MEIHKEYVILLTSNGLYKREIYNLTKQKDRPMNLERKVKNTKIETVKT